MYLRTLQHRLSLFALTILLCASEMQAFAHAGQLDPSFGNKGIFSAASTGLTSLSAVAVRRDGKIVVAGRGTNSIGFDTLIRLETDGTLDTSFGSGGIVNLLPPGDVYDVFGFFSLAIQSDGKILAAADDVVVPLGQGMQIARVEPNGSLDTSFGSGGFTTEIVTSPNSGNLALQGDGKILVVSGDPNGGVMARYTTSGQLDTTFGSSGLVILSPNPTQVVEQANEQILVAEGVWQPGMIEPGTINRYNSDGSLDTTFGNGGTVTSAAGALALLLQRNGEFVVAGALTDMPPRPKDIGFAVVRYRADGTIDQSFGAEGVAFADFGERAPSAYPFVLAIQSNGDVVAGGGATFRLRNNGTHGFMSLARFTSTGQLDTTFGSGGRVLTGVGRPSEVSISGLAIQSDGKIVAVGTGGECVVARYLAE